jgi:hypothetical protein
MISQHDLVVHISLITKIDIIKTFLNVHWMLVKLFLTLNDWDDGPIIRVNVLIFFKMLK